MAFRVFTQKNDLPEADRIIVAIVLQLYGAIFVEAVWTVKTQNDVLEQDMRERCFICSKELIKPGFLWALYFANYVFKVSA